MVQEDQPGKVDADVKRISAGGKVFNFGHHKISFALINLINFYHLPLQKTENYSGSFLWRFR